MRHLFREVPEACDNTLWVAERAELEITFGAALLPDFPLPEGFADDRAYLEHLTWDGARRRWGDSLPQPVVERLSYELEVISSMGFASYFLIVWDLIRHARESGIRVGPGRGSAAGCAVAYCLWITDLDPIRYDLLFERFLNPSRVSMPDIDMDFDSRYRDEMIRYAAQRYGRDHVAQIITFGTIKARNAVRDAAPTASATGWPRRCPRWSWVATRRSSTASSRASSTPTASRRRASCAPCTTATPTSGASSTWPRVSRV
jgi:DNA polymerase-3 subunit alpha